VSYRYSKYLAILVTLLLAYSCSSKKVKEHQTVPVEVLVERLIDITLLTESDTPKLIMYMTPGSCSTCRSYAFKMLKYLNKEEQQDVNVILFGKKYMFRQNYSDTDCHITHVGSLPFEKELPEQMGLFLVKGKSLLDYGFANIGQTEVIDQMLMKYTDTRNQNL